MAAGGKSTLSLLFCLDQRFSVVSPSYFLQSNGLANEFSILSKWRILSKTNLQLLCSDRSELEAALRMRPLLGAVN